MSLCVLVADENPSLKRVFKLTLEDKSADIKSVHSGDEVFNFVKNYNPDIVFLDVLLSKKDGYEVCYELKENFQKIPVILMWNSFNPLNEDRFKECRADGSLKKPFDIHQIRELIDQYILAKEVPSDSILDHMIFPDMPELEDMEEDESQKNSSGPLFENEVLPEAQAQEESVNKAQTTKPEVDQEVQTNEKPDIIELGAAQSEVISLEKHQESQKPYPERALDEKQTEKVISEKESEEKLNHLNIDFTKVSDSIEGFTEKKIEDQVKTPDLDEVSGAHSSVATPSVVTPSNPLEKQILELTRQEVQRLAREIVPKMAVKILKEELIRLLKDDDKKT